MDLTIPLRLELMEEVTLEELMVVNHGFHLPLDLQQMNPKLPYVVLLMQHLSMDEEALAMVEHGCVDYRWCVACETCVYTQVASEWTHDFHMTTRMASPKHELWQAMRQSDTSWKTWPVGLMWGIQYQETG